MRLRGKASLIRQSGAAVGTLFISSSFGWYISLAARSGFRNSEDGIQETYSPLEPKTFHLLIVYKSKRISSAVK